MSTEVEVLNKAAEIIRTPGRWFSTYLESPYSANRYANSCAVIAIIDASKDLEYTGSPYVGFAHYLVNNSKVNLQWELQYSFNCYWTVAAWNDLPGQTPETVASEIETYAGTLK